MSDSEFTPALLVFFLAFGPLMAFLEMLLVKRPFIYADSGLTLIQVAGVNVAFLFALLLFMNTFPWLIFPIPFVPAGYLVSKAVVYTIGQAFARGPRMSWWVMILFMVLLYAPLPSLLKFNPNIRNLSKAISDNDNGVLQFWVRAGVKPNPDQIVPLMNSAILDDNVDAVQMLIGLGADPRRDYFTSVINGYQSRRSQWLVQKWMLDSGLKPEEIEHLAGYPFKDLALRYGPAELEYCIQKGFDPAQHPDVLHWALHNQQLRAESVQHPDGSFTVEPQPGEIESLHDKIVLLLNHGANVNRLNGWKESPLHYLTSAGFDFYRDISLTRDRDSLTPAMNVFSPTDLSPILSLLIEKGADVNVQTVLPIEWTDSSKYPAGLTPLMLAVINNKPSYVAILVKAGANRALRDADAKSALDYARERSGSGGEALVKLLEDADTETFGKYRDFLSFPNGASIGQSEPGSAVRANLLEERDTETYLNGKYRYSVTFPKGRVIGQGESGSGDGQVFKSKDGSLKITVWGIFNAREQTISDLCKEDVDEGASSPSGDRGLFVLAFKSVQGSVCAFSGVRGGNTVVYRKTILADDFFKTIYLEYPVQQKQTLDPVVTRIVGSFQSFPDPAVKH
jgi:hypothetical protein